MKIVRCSSCRRLVHEESLCLFCGNRSSGESVSSAAVHENAQTSFSLAESLVLQGRFDEALATLDEVMKWSPNCSEVHWLRLLARNRCKNDRELFFSGVCVIGTPDHETALRYASEEERQVYTSVGNSCAALRKTLLDMIRSRNKAVIEKLDLTETLSQMRKFIGEKQTTLLSSWQELRKCEQELKLLENEGEYFIHECKTNTQAVRDMSTQIRQSLENTGEIDREQYFRYKLKLESLQKTADAAKDEYYRLRAQHPSVAAFAELCQRRSALRSAIGSMLEEIKEYEQKTEAVISQINSAEEDCRMLLQTAEEGNYRQVISLLGQNNFDRAVKYALSQE